MAFRKFSLLSLLLALQLAIGLVSAAPQDTTDGVAGRPGGPGGGGPPGNPGGPGRRCKKIHERKEWRRLSVANRLDYIRSIKCLMSKPSFSTRTGVISRYDEFQSSHIDLTLDVHLVGHFLPWHRHFINLFNKALREECGYKGPATFWDWTLDSDVPGQIRNSPIFDEVTGFGGDGVPGTYTMPDTWVQFPGFPVPGCVTTGPFNTTKLNLGVGATFVGPRCLVRAIDDVWSPLGTTSEMVSRTMSRTNFEDFRNVLEQPFFAEDIPNFGVHGGGHWIVGGEMSDPFSSPGDPLFYLHHANLDRIWDKWQRINPSQRLYEISGPIAQNPTPTTPNVTLDFMMPFTSLSTPVAVRDLMDSEREPSCFRYVDN